MGLGCTVCTHHSHLLTHWPDTWVLGVLCVHTTVTYSLARYMGLGSTVCTHHSHLLTHWPDTWVLGVLCVHTTVTYSLTGLIHGSWVYCVYTPQSLTHWPDTWGLGVLCVHTTVTCSLAGYMGLGCTVCTHHSHLLTGLIHGSWVYCVYTPQSLTHWPDTWGLGVLCVYTTVTSSENIPLLRVLVYPAH